MRRVMIVGLVITILLSSMVIMADEDFEADGMPTRAIWRSFGGWIEGLNLSNPDGVPSVFGLNITGMSPPPSPQKLPPVAATISLNATSSGNFSAFLDISTHDPSQPWTFTLDDCYGWNETGGVVGVQVQNPSPWPASIHYITNGTLGYYKGVFGNISITVYNGSSGQPLEGVSFRFDKHVWHNSFESGNYTDASGNVEFDNLQLGLDSYLGQNNLVKVYVLKDNFTFNNGNGSDIAYLPLFVNKTTHYTLTIDEDPLVRSSAPSSEMNTGIPVEKDRVPNDVFVEFFDDIDQASVGMDTLYLKEVSGEKVNITYQWPTSKICKIRPNEDLEYNTEYEVLVTPLVKNTTGYPQLWRTFRFNFTTQLAPGVLRCQVTINGTSNPAPAGSMIRLDSSLPQFLVNGFYQFNSVLPTVGGHTITVSGPTVGGNEEYLYEGNSIAGIEVERGQTIDVLGLHVTKRPVRSAIITIVGEDDTPLFGAIVTHSATLESKTTDLLGKVVFNEILMERDSGFTITYPNYKNDAMTITNGTIDPVLVTKKIYEKELPVVLKARTDFTTDLSPGTIIPVESKIQIEFKEKLGPSYDMNIDTMTTDNLKILNEENNVVPIDIESTPGDASRWSLVPRDFLAYDSNYTIFIDESVATLTGGNPLWRDFTLSVETEALKDSTVVGTVSTRGKGVGGVKVEVLQNGVVKAKGTTSENGGYAIPIKHNDFTLMNITVRADGTKVGLSTGMYGPITLNSGGSREGADFELTRLPDWFQVLYPKDDEGRMPVTGTFTIKFKVSLDHSDMETFVDNFTLRNPEMDLNISVSDDGKTVIVDPVEILDNDKIYTLSVGAEFQDEFFRELKDINGSFALPRGEVVQIKTEFKPIEVILQTPSSNILDNVPVDTPISIFFTNYSMDKTKIENSFELKGVISGEAVGNLSFTWSLDDQKVEIDHDRLMGSTEYLISLSPGKYGAGTSSGAMIKDDFLVYFTTVPVMINVPVVPNWPETLKAGAKMVVTLENPLGIGIKVAILIEEVRGSGNYVEKANVTLAKGEKDRQVTLDTENYKRGDYKALIRVYDPSKDPIVLLDEFPLNLEVVKDDSSGPDSILWVFIVIGAIVILIAILAVFLIAQSRKKDIEEELKEEFECPECHHLVGDDDTVCPHCGAEFEEQAYKCPKCGSMLEPEDEECSECGYDFSDQDQMELEDDSDDEDIELEEEDDEELELEEDDEMEEVEEED